MPFLEVCSILQVLIQLEECIFNPPLQLPAAANSQLLVTFTGGGGIQQSQELFISDTQLLQTQGL